MTVYTRSDLPELRAGDTVQMETTAGSLGGEIQSVSDVGASDVIKIEIDGTIRDIHADRKSVELLKDGYVFVRDLQIS